MTCRFDLDIFDLDAPFKSGKDPKQRPHSKFRSLDFDSIDRILSDMRKKYE